MLTNKETRDSRVVQYLLGWYLYWDMSCAFTGDPEDVNPLDPADVLAALKHPNASFHSMIGSCAELFYYISWLGRYCRRVMGSGNNNLALEAFFEGQILAFVPKTDDSALKNMSLAYRNHGLIMLYKICGRSSEMGDHPSWNSG